jgi:hypothetical protein
MMSGWLAYGAVVCRIFEVGRYRMLLFPRGRETKTLYVGDPRPRGLSTRQVRSSSCDARGEKGRPIKNHSETKFYFTAPTTYPHD